MVDSSTRPAIESFAGHFPSGLRAKFIGILACHAFTACFRAQENIMWIKERTRRFIPLHKSQPTCAMLSGGSHFCYYPKTTIRVFLAYISSVRCIFQTVGSSRGRRNHNYDTIIFRYMIFESRASESDRRQRIVNR
jgi:hypothetical protein